MKKSAVRFLVMLLIFCLRSEAKTNRTKNFSYVLKLAGTTDFDINQNFLRSGFLQGMTHINSNWTVSNIPKHFDLRKDPNCGKVISKIRDQGHCGSHWAVALASVMTDRYCLEHPEHPFVEFSAEDILFCCTECTNRTEANYYNDTCNTGGNVVRSLMYLYNEGLVTGSHFSNEGCKPYTNLTVAGKSSECDLYCTNPEFDPTRSYTEDKVYAKELFIGLLPSELTIQVELMTNGPVVTSIHVTDHFSNYRGGIYREPETDKNKTKKFDLSNLKGGHAVRIIGWGEKKGIRYWIVANSWGEHWGENGFFRIVRGVTDLDNHTFVRSKIVQSSFHYRDIYYIPEHFDLRDDPNCGELIRRVRNQGLCGSCWAVASTSIMIDRYCLAHPKHPFVEFSVEDLLFCCPECTSRKRKNYHQNPCEVGGNSETAMEYLYNEGLATGSYFSNEGCKPLTNATLIKLGKRCQLYCTNPEFDPTRSYTEDKVYAEEVFAVEDFDTRDVQKELMTNGPVVVLFIPPDDFNLYKGGVYRKSRRIKPGSTAHAVRLVGWGEEEDGEDYWIAANSWGKDWGEDGFFRIVRGENHLGIETYAFAVIPQIDYIYAANDAKASVWSIYVISVLILLYF